LSRAWHIFWPYISIIWDYQSSSCSFSNPQGTCSETDHTSHRAEQQPDSFTLQLPSLPYSTLPQDRLTFLLHVSGTNPPLIFQVPTLRRRRTAKHPSINNASPYTTISAPPFLSIPPFATIAQPSFHSPYPCTSFLALSNILPPSSQDTSKPLGAPPPSVDQVDHLYPRAKLITTPWAKMVFA
jgi:hypothetical protein